MTPANMTLCYWRENDSSGWIMVCFGSDEDRIRQLARRMQRQLGLTLHIHQLEGDQAVTWCSVDGTPPVMPTQHSNYEAIQATIDALHAEQV